MPAIDVISHRRQGIRCILGRNVVVTELCDVTTYYVKPDINFEEKLKLLEMLKYHIRRTTEWFVSRNADVANAPLIFVTEL